MTPMQLHTLQRATPNSPSRRIGRGGKRGTTAGRGTKGQKARAGAKIRPAIRDTIKKLPKLRGYRFHSFRPQPAIVPLSVVAERFAGGAVVTPQLLAEHGLLRRRAGRMPSVKVVGSTPLSQRLSFRGIRLSGSARRAIEAAGGTIVP